MELGSTGVKYKNKENGGNSVLGAAFSLTVSTIIVKLLGLIYKIPLTRFLGEEGMGYFNSAYTVYGVFFLTCTAGVPKAVMMHLLDKDATDTYRSRIIRISIYAFLTFGGVMTVLFASLSGAMAHLIGSDSSRYTMLVIAPSILFVSLGGVLRGVLSAEMKLLNVAVSQIIEGVGKLALGLVFAYHGIRIGMPLELLSAYTILGVTVGSVFGFIYLYITSGVFVSLRKSREKIPLRDAISLLRKIFSVSLPITLSALIMSMTGIIDLLFVMQRLAGIGYSEIEATALYGNYTTLAVPMYNLIISVLTPISVAFLPIFIRSHVKEDIQLRDSSLKSSLDLTAIICAPMVIGIMAYPGEILSLLFGNIGISDGAPLLLLMMPAAVLMSLLLIANSLLESRGDVRAPVFAMLIGCILKLVITYFLVGNSDYGISGAPIGTVVSYGIALFIAVRRLVKKHGIHLPILRTHFMPYLNAMLSVMLSRRIYSAAVGSVGENVSLLIAVAFTAVTYTLLCVFCGVISKKKIKMVANYTKMTA